MGLKTLPNLGRVVRGTLASRRILNDFKPDVLLFTGGYVAVPMALAGRNLPSLVYVPDIEPGIALKLLARFATVIALTAEDSRAYFPAAKRMVVTGYPLRPELSEWTRQRGQSFLGLAPDRFTLLVSGGSSGARSINHAVLAILPQLLAEMQVVHLTGKLDWEEVQAAQAALPAALRGYYHPQPYLHEMGAALAAADLAVTRAGASTLGELPLFGLPAILVPYPHAWRYQKVNADYLVRRGAAMLMVDATLPAELLPAVQQLSHDPTRLQQMRQAMQSLARPQAAGHLASTVRDLAQERKPNRTESARNREK
jgi:UDP-N-acetylglucosamine--N-acetylmuramyl-(pentapeptide) pyrophosphoryl-undecaprenol N-acetylglucosamine transferase